jgi:3',5'-cyclic AMP phosphodiesterase CpdA
MSTPRPITLLHLSDLQFGRYHRFERPSATTQQGSPDNLFTRIQEDLELLMKEEGLTPDLLVVTGDLTEWGRKSEFDEVLSFLERMTGFLGLTRDHVLVVPGNHDVDRKACESYFLSCDSEEQQPQEPYWPKFRHYERFFRKYYESFPDIGFSEKEPWTFFEVPKLKLVAAGLNSTLKESHREQDHYGWVGEEQLRWFAGKLRTYKERGWMRLGLVHHNVMRRATNDAENLRDVDDLKRLLGGELNLLLHGHTHEGRLEWLGPRLPVLSTGSTSVIQEARPPEVPNQYQFIRLLPDLIWHGARMYAPDQKRWVGDNRASVQGNQWNHEERVSFEHVNETFRGGGALRDEGKDRLARVVESYRAYVAATFQRQPLHDLCTHAEDQDIPSGIELLDIFIPQAVSLTPPPKDLPREAEPEEVLTGVLGEEEGGLVSWGESPALPVEQVLLDLERPWVVLLGAPGAGKTSLTRWLCLKLCAPGEQLQNLSSELVPVRVEMRRFDERYRAATAQARTYDFFSYLDQEHAEKALDLQGEVLRELGVSGRLVWLFDGMDEVSDRVARKRYAEMILGLRAAGGSRGLITSRIVGAQPLLPYFQAAGVPVCTLLDFDGPRIQEFITRWHDKAFQATPEVGKARRERLERVIAESPPVHELCKNPLLLTLIALLNRGGELPRRRHLLYRRAIELMAIQWEANKGLPPSAEFQLEVEDRIAFLRELAWWMMFELPEGGRNLVQEEDLLRFTSQFLEVRYSRTQDQARHYANGVIGYLRERNYILARIGARLFGFVHKTFFEYLVADAIRSRFAGRDLDLGWLENLFRQIWFDGAQQEVLTLVCGMLEEDRPENVMRLLQSVLRWVEVFPVRQIDFGAFAVRCLAEVRQLDREPIRTFMVRLAELARHEMEHSEGEQEPSFADAIHLIGTRWPEREHWLLWARQRGKLHVNTRILANACAFDTMSAEQHMAFLLETLKNEWSASVTHHVLARANQPESSIHDLLLHGEESVRCGLARGLLFQAAEGSLYQGKLDDAAIDVLEELVEGSQSFTIKARAASLLTRLSSSPLIGEVLLKVLRNPSSGRMALVGAVQGLARMRKIDPQFKTELLAFLVRSASNPLMRKLSASTLIQLSKFLEAVESILSWIEQPLSLSERHWAMHQLSYLAATSTLVHEHLERARLEAGTERLRAIASRACEEALLMRDLRQIETRKPVNVLEMLESPTTPEPIQRKLIWRLMDATLLEANRSRVLDILRKMTSPSAPPMSRVQAARVMWALSLTPEEEHQDVFRDLLNTNVDEETRLLAAQMLGEEGSLVIEQLASSATDLLVRAEAELAHRSLQLRARLQAAGSESPP